MIRISKLTAATKLTEGRFIWTGASFILLLIAANCAYFNTFYNAKNYYNQGRRLVPNDTVKVDSDLFDKAIEKSVVVIVKYPTSRWTDDALFIMGSSYYYKGDYNRALEKLDLLIASYPESPRYFDGLYFRGLCYYKMGRYNAAILQLQDLIPEKKYQKRARLALGYVHYRQGNYQALVQIADSLLVESLNNKERQQVLTLRAEAQFNLGRYDDALMSYQALLKATLAPEEKRRLKLKIGQAYLATGRYEESQNFLVGEDEPEFKALIADIYFHLGDTLEARQAYRDLIATNRSEYLSLAYFKLAEQLEQADSVEQAIAFYDSAYQRGSGDYAGQAQKRSTILKRIAALEADTLTADRSAFLLAEMYYVEFDDIPKALAAYRHVDSAYAASAWAAKALYAQFWITKHVLGQDSTARFLAAELNRRYPGTEYDRSAFRILRGDTTAVNDTRLVPDPTPRRDTTAAVDTLAPMVPLPAPDTAVVVDTLVPMIRPPEPDTTRPAVDTLKSP